MHLFRRQNLALFVLCLLACRTSPALSAAPEVTQAIAGGVSYLKDEIPNRAKSGEAVLGALALVKAGEAPSEPAVQAVVKEVVKRCSGNTYKPHSHHFYVAGLEIMLFEAVDPVRYRPEMKKVLQYILEGQRKSGAWYYPNQGGSGDTSITQYAALGMWSAERVGLDVPASAWDRMAAWHLRTQLKNGAFAYHPGEPGKSGPAPALTIGGAANMLLAHLHLYGDPAQQKAKKKAAKSAGEQEKALYGVLESVELDEPAGPKGARAKDQPITSTSGNIEQSVLRARNRAAISFRLPPTVQFKMYYLYALERMAALGNMKMLGPHDWYSQGAALLITKQKPNGTWDIDGGDPIASAAFGVLFLTRSTAKMLGRTIDVPELGSGLLAGGRGLPSDLNKVDVTGGNVETREEEGPLGDLLARLETAGVGDVPELQTAILDSVRFGDREKLLAERDRIRKLVDHPRPDVRRTAFWVLGRAGDLSDVPRLIKGLSDVDTNVAVEAHNGLCILSRRPFGFDIPPDPFAQLDPEAGDKERAAALEDWSEQATKAWTDWYAKAAPYEERDGLGLFGAQGTAAGKSPDSKGKSGSRKEPAP